jgi:hypothetical protein
MASKSVLDYVKSKAISARTTVRLPGARLTLQGMPATYTDGGLAKLAETQPGGTVRVATDRVATETDKTAASIAVLTGKDAAFLLRANTRDGTVNAGKDKDADGEAQPNRNGAAVAAASAK